MLRYEEKRKLDIERLEKFLNYKINKDEAKAFIKATGGFINARQLLEETVPVRSTEIYKDEDASPLNLKIRIKIKQYYNNLTTFERIEFIRKKLKSNNKNSNK